MVMKGISIGALIVSVTRAFVIKVTQPKLPDFLAPAERTFILDNNGLVYFIVFPHAGLSAYVFRV